MNTINDKCTAIVKHFEGLHDGNLSVIGLQPKMCPAGIWTEGYGDAIIDPMTGKFLKYEKNKARAYKLSKIKTEEEATYRLSLRLTEFSAKVIDICNELNMRFDDNKFSALVSFTYNCGKNALREFLISYKSGLDITHCFLMYRYARINGEKKELPGLVRRRKSEAWLFTTGTLKFTFPR